MVKENLTEEDKSDIVTDISFGSEDLSLVSVENEDYVSNLTASDVFGSRASYNDEDKQLTIEIAIPDTEIETATQSAYAKVLDADSLIAKNDSTLMNLMKASSGDSAVFREFKNCVLKAVIDTTTGNIVSYTVTYQSKTYVAQASVGLGNTLKATLKGVEFEKDHIVKYENFKWPKN